MSVAVDNLALESERLALRLQEEELQARQDALLAQRLAVMYACNVDEEDYGDVEFVKEVNPVTPSQEVGARLMQVKEHLREVPTLRPDAGPSAAAASSRGAAHPHQPSTYLNTGGSGSAGGSGGQKLAQPNKLEANMGPSSAAGDRAGTKPQDQSCRSMSQPDQAPKPNGGDGPSSSSAAAAACSKGTTTQKPPPQQATSAAACAGAPRPLTSHQTQQPQQPQPQSQSQPQVQQPQQPSRPQPTSTIRPSTVAQMLAPASARSSTPSMDSRRVARAQSKAQDAATSSGAAVPSVTRATIECQSCYDRFPPEGVRCAGTDAPSSSSAAPGCGHYFCAPCRTQYVRGAVSDRKCPVPCPMAAGGGGGEGGRGAKGCGAKIPRDEVLELLEAFPKEQQAFTMLEAEQTIDPDLKIYCPHKDCSTVLLGPEGQVAGQNEPITCPACNRAFCLRCRIPGWHQGYTCAQFQALPPHQRSAEDAAVLRLSAKQQWKQCPSCKQMVERSVGCNHIRCRCTCDFCYACGKEYRANSQDCGCPLFDLPNDDVDPAGDAIPHGDVNSDDGHGSDGGSRARAAGAGGRAGGRRGGVARDNRYGQNEPVLGDGDQDGNGRGEAGGRRHGDDGTEEDEGGYRGGRARYNYDRYDDEDSEDDEEDEFGPPPTLRVVHVVRLVPSAVAGHGGDGGSRARAAGAGGRRGRVARGNRYGQNESTLEDDEEDEFGPPPPPHLKNVAMHVARAMNVVRLVRSALAGR